MLWVTCERDLEINWSLITLQFISNSYGIGETSDDDNDLVFKQHVLYSQNHIPRYRFIIEIIIILN